MKILGRDIALARVPHLVSALALAAYRALTKFRDPLEVLTCYVRRRPPQAGLLRLRDGKTLFLSSYPHDIVTVFVVFCKEEYGHDFAGKTVLDIGANIGCFALMACQHDCRHLVAVEPSPESCEALRRNLAENGYQSRCVTIHAAVCGTAIGNVPFPVASNALNSLEGAAQAEATVDVPTTTLGALLDEHFPDGVDLLKMDCEGSEIGIVADASDSDLLRLREIRMEFHGPDFGPTVSRLHGLGFRTVLHDQHGPVGANLWLRREGEGLPPARV